MIIRFVFDILDLLPGLVAIWFGGAFLFGMTIGVIQVFLQPWLEERRRVNTWSSTEEGVGGGDKGDVIEERPCHQ